MSRRSALASVVALVALVALALVAAWWSERGAPREHGVAVLDADASVGAAAAPAVLAPEDPAGVDAPARAVERALVELGAATEGDAPDDAPGPTRVAGSVVLVGLDGAEREGESGELTVSVQDPPTYGRVRVGVVDGRFELDAPVGARLSPRGALLGGRPAYRASDTPRPRVVPGEPVRLVVQEVARTLLRVEDRDSGEPLNGVEVRFSPGWHVHEHLRVPPSRAVLAPVGDRSPIPLDPLLVAADSHEGTLYARAPGYAWSGTMLDLRAGGERLLWLGAGGALDVTVRGEATDEASLYVRALDPDETVLAWRAVPNGVQASFDGLPVERVRVSVEAGAHTFAAVDADVPRDGRAAVELALPPFDAAPLVPFAGTVVVPAAWPAIPRRLMVRRHDPSPTGRRAYSQVQLEREPASGTDDRYPFDGGELEPGRYTATLTDPTFAFEFDLPLSGLADARFEVPPPVDVVVRVVSAATGEPLRPRWGMAGSPSMPGGPVTTFSSLPLHADTGEYRLRVPVGEVVVRVEAFQSDGAPYAGAEARLPAVAGQGAQTMAVGPGQGLRVRYRCDGAPVPAQHVEAELEAVAGEGEPSGSDWGDDHLLYFVSEPGAYTVTVDPPNGYRAPQAIVVDLPAGEIVERTIELELDG